MDMDVGDFLPRLLSNICADIEARDSDIATQNFEAAFNGQIVDRLPFCHCARKIVGDMPPRYDETMQRRDRNLSRIAIAKLFSAIKCSESRPQKIQGSFTGFCIFEKWPFRHLWPYPAPTI
jgi:hypothetical protein